MRRGDAGSSCARPDNSTSAILEYEVRIPENLRDDISISEMIEENDSEILLYELEEPHSDDTSQPIYESEHGARFFDFIELVCRETGEVVEVREGDFFEGFIITDLERTDVYYENLETWRTRVIVTYEKELTLTGTFRMGGEYFGFPGSTYLVISEEDVLQYLPQDIYGILTEQQGIFFIVNDEIIQEMILELGEEFEQIAIVTISHVHLMRTSHTLGNSVEIIDFEVMNGTDK